MSATVEFADLTKAEDEIVYEIVTRGLALLRSLDVLETRTALTMDISATHRLCPLKLQELLDADDFNFNHDLLGIRRHLNRETGELEDFFLPRFAQ